MLCVWPPSGEMLRDREREREREGEREGERLYRKQCPSASSATALDSSSVFGKRMKMGYFRLDGVIRAFMLERVGGGGGVGGGFIDKEEEEEGLLTNNEWWRRRRRRRRFY